MKGTLQCSLLWLCEQMPETAGSARARLLVAYHRTWLAMCKPLVMLLSGVLSITLEP